MLLESAKNLFDIFGVLKIVIKVSPSFKEAHGYDEEKLFLQIKFFLLTTFQKLQTDFVKII